MDTNRVSVDRTVLLGAHDRLIRLRTALASLEVDTSKENQRRIRAAGRHELEPLVWLLSDWLGIPSGAPVLTLPLATPTAEDDMPPLF